MISFVIPIYNAERILLRNYNLLKGFLDGSGLPYEILFLDDYSSDNSRNIIEAISAANMRVKAFCHARNSGLGSVLRKLFQEASGDHVIYLDIDLPFGLEGVKRLTEEMDTADVVVASRYTDRSLDMPLLRRISSRSYYLLCRMMFGIAVRDIGSGTVIFRKDALERLKLSACGFEIHAELFSKFRQAGLRLKEIPLEYKHNGYGTFSIIRHGPATVCSTLKLWIKR